MKSSMNIALIGCGRIGYLLENDPLRRKPCTHYGGLAAARLRCTHLCDKNKNRLSRLAETAGIPASNCFTDYRELFRRTAPHLAVIATWTDSHAACGIAAAKSGTRVIVLEKPITSSLKDAAKLIDTCREHGTHLLINHERRYDNRYRTVKKMLQSGIIGDVKTVHGSILTAGHRGPSLPEQGGGPLLHDGTHLVDMMRFLFGDIQWVEGEFSREKRSCGFEDRATAWCRTSGGVDLFMEAGGSRDYFVFELVISGTEGKIIIGNGYESLLTRRKSRLYTGFKDLVEKPFPSFGKNNCFHEIYREARSLLAGNETVITSSGLDGYRALEAIHAIYLSSYLGGKRIPLPMSPGSINLKKIFTIT